MKITKIAIQYGSGVREYYVGVNGVVSIKNIESPWMGLFEIQLGNGSIINVNKNFVIDFLEEQTISNH